MDQEEVNLQTMKEFEMEALPSDSNGSSLLNMNCDSNAAMLESAEEDRGSRSGSSHHHGEAGDGKHMAGQQPVDFGNLDEMLAESGENCDTDIGDRKADAPNIEADTKQEDNDECDGMQELEDEAAQQRKEQEALYSNVQVMTIDDPDDDDLFDFKREPESEMDNNRQFGGNLESSELYKYLTEQDVARLRSLEVTPSQSRQDSGESSEGSEEYTSSESEEEEETPSKHESSSSHQEETPIKSYPQPGRRKPAYKPGRPALQLARPPQKKSAALAAHEARLSAKTLDKLEKSKQVTEKWIKDLAIPENLSLTQGIQLNILELNQYLTCGLCKGYLYEASTVTECMHTFCKNCIVRHCMEVSLHCPVCSILIHPTDPFVNIRLDRMIQDIVYKLLPKVAQTEMERIKEFYIEHPEVEAREIQPNPAKPPKVSPKDKELKEKVQTQMVSLLLETEEEDTQSESLEKKFIRVTSRATIANVCTYLKRKLNLANQSEVELYCCGDAVEDDACTLENIKSKFFGEQDCLMLMQYRVRES